MILVVKPIMKIGKIRIERYALNAVKSQSDIPPVITKCHQSTRMIRVAKLVHRVIIGIRVANIPKIRKLISLAFRFAARNFWYSKVCELRRRISAEPTILSLMILLSVSNASCVSLNRTLTLENIKAKTPPIIGRTIITDNASFQLIKSSSVLAPIMRKIDEISEEIDCETNPFTPSTSEVILVKIFEGVMCCM